MMDWFRKQEHTMTTEIPFIIEDAPEGGYIARAVTASIFTEADSLAQLRESVREAVACHFDEGERPRLIRLHYVRDEVIAA
jgi:hypothetical protein